MAIEYAPWEGWVDYHGFWIYPLGAALRSTDHWLVSLQNDGNIYVVGIGHAENYPEFNEEFMAPYIDTLPRWVIEMLADWAKKNDSN